MPGKQPIFPLDANKLLAKVRRMNARAQKEREARARDEQEHIKSLRVKVHTHDHITTLHPLPHYLCSAATLHHTALPHPRLNCLALTD